MSQINTEPFITSIYCQDGLDPEQLAVDFVDPETGEAKPGLTVLAKLAWFRKVYPDGKPAIETTDNGEYVTARARIYKSCTDPIDQYIGEAEATRGPDPKYPAKETAQSAALSLALRNAGFILPSSLKDRVTDDENRMSGQAHTPTSGNQANTSASAQPASPAQPVQQQPAPPAAAQAQTPAPQVEVPQEKQPEPPAMTLDQAYAVPCPIKKHAGKTLGELVGIDNSALTWLSEKFSGDDQVKTAARLICENAFNQASAS